MEAKDLRLGNYLKFHSKIEQVESITDSDWIRLNKSDSVPINAVGLKPIELKEEWLLKLGFNNEYKTGYIGIDVNNNDFVLSYPKVLGDFQKSFAFEFRAGNWPKFKELKYVHELQNLFFALTGEELTINEEK